jgi:hypothetical protein
MMTRGKKALLIVLLSATVLCVGTVTLGAAVAYRAGSVSVHIQDGGDDFSIRIPAILADAALSLAPRSALDEAAAELRPFLPALEPGWRELAAAPDFVLVEVVSKDDSVWIEKRGGALQIRVTERDSEIRVALPLSTIGGLCRKLGGGGRRARGAPAEHESVRERHAREARHAACRRGI